MTSNRLPDFFIIGAAKSGTSNLHSILTKHPNVFMPTPKEPEFFARDDLYNKGIEAYAGNFYEARPDQIVGEASTIYTLSPFFPETAKRIRYHTPNAKFIYIIREPVTRSFSYYKQIIRNYQRESGSYEVNRTFEEFLDNKHAAPRDRVFASFDEHLPDHPDLCIAGSDYLYQINKYLEVFDIEKFHFIKFEDFIRNEAKELKKITAFLGIDPLPPEAFSEERWQNISDDYFAQASDLRKVQMLSRTLGPAWEVRRALPKSFRSLLKEKFLQYSSRKSAAPQRMKPETMDVLSTRLLKDIDKLQGVTGLDLSSWQDLASTKPIE